MTESVVAAQSQAAPLLRIGSLQSVVDAVCASLKLGDGSESLIERPLVRKWRKASIADVLITVELNQVRFMQPTSTHIVGSQVAARSDLLLDAEVVLVVVRRLEGSRGE